MTFDLRSGYADSKTILVDPYELREAVVARTMMLLKLHRATMVWDEDFENDLRNVVYGALEDNEVYSIDD